MYFMLQTELPFGSWRDSELEIFGRIARRQLSFPPSFSPETRDLIDKVNPLDPIFLTCALVYIQLYYMCLYNTAPVHLATQYMYAIVNFWDNTSC